MAARCPPIPPNLSPLPLPSGITSSYIKTPALTYHILSSGAPTKEDPAKKPLILLLHGFPELAYSWRKIMPSLGKDGYHVVAYDQRGYGRTTGWDTRDYHDVDLNSFRMTEVVKDAVRLVNALGYNKCECIVGHDFGAVGAALAGVIRPDVFKKVVLMSHPFSGIPAFPLGTNADGVAAEVEDKEIETCLHELAQLQKPRKHYKWYYASDRADDDMTHPKEGNLRDFLRGYFFLKSGNNVRQKRPQELGGWKAEEMAKMPGYYIMPWHKTMVQTVANDVSEQPFGDAAASKSWLSNEELDVYVSEFERNGFQGGLNYYRVGTSRELQSDLEVFRGKNIEVPSMFMAGEMDWGIYQTPGALHDMRNACPGSRGFMKVVDAGHWVMQEKPEEVVGHLRVFLKGEDFNGIQWHGL